MYTINSWLYFQKNVYIFVINLIYFIQNVFMIFVLLKHFKTIKTIKIYVL